MSPRQNRRRRDERAERPDRHGLESVEEWPDGDWAVRAVTGSSSKTYRCPGCDQQLPGTVPHVVVWPADGAGGPDDRRHWHRPCWNARLRRGVKVHRSKNAPRYG